MTVVAADPDLIARTVLACPAVDALDAGEPGSVATYLPGRQIAGVSVDEHRVAVQVRMRWGTTVQMLQQQVRAVLQPLVGNRRIDIAVSDIALPTSADGRPGIPPAPA